MALAASAAFVAARVNPEIQLVAATVDHGWHAKSGEIARRTGQLCAEWGIEHYVLTPHPGPVTDTSEAVSQGGGLEAVAREDRYRLLHELGRQRDADAILVGHTRDDQAETVLMGLARGSGLRSLAGMDEIRGLVCRPFLDLARQDTQQICSDLSIPTWQDPANQDRRFLRVRTRHEAVPAVSAAFGQDVTVPLARTARLVRQDLHCLEELAQKALDQATAWNGDAVRSDRDPTDRQGVVLSLDIDTLATLHPAILGRVVQSAAKRAGCDAAALGSRHVDAVSKLVAQWRGQGPAQLPGKVEVARAGKKLEFRQLVG